MIRILDLYLEMFMEAFNSKFFPKSIHQHKEREFIKLEQENRIVAEYEANFSHLEKFALDLVATKERRSRRFKEGLRPRIKQAVIPLKLTTYREVVSKLLLVERAQLLDPSQVVTGSMVEILGDTFGRIMAKKEGTIKTTIRPLPKQAAKKDLLEVWQGAFW
ncbi:Retrotrans gag domain-containing protein [Abeliophyllum distichum]|uniref:Retrotrans gag domain-containing protein n=1 Tax=Abeliophyllum distichum TaxID=126358 RepID=A0ABD1SCJ0_9LAMI